MSGLGRGFYRLFIIISFLILILPTGCAQEEQTAAPSNSPPASGPDGSQKAREVEHSTSTPTESTTADKPRPALEPSKGTEMEAALADAEDEPPGPVQVYKAPDQVTDLVANVNGIPVSSPEFEREINRLLQEFYRRGQTPSQEQMPKIRKLALDNLTNRLLLYQESIKGDYQPDDALLEKQVQQIKQRFPDNDQYKKALRRMKLTEDDLRNELKMGLMVQQFIKQEFADKTRVSEEESRDYYEAHPEYFQQEEQVRARHILAKFSSRDKEKSRAQAYAKIKQIQDRIIKGEDFSVLAAEASDCPSRTRGGDLGYFSRGDMVPPFDKAVFAMEPGEISDIVETNFGYHLIKVEDKRAQGVPPFEKVKSRAALLMKQAKMKKDVDRFLGLIRDKAEVQIFVPAGQLEDNLEERVEEKLDRLPQDQLESAAEKDVRLPAAQADEEKEEVSGGLIIEVPVSNPSVRWPDAWPEVANGVGNGNNETHQPTHLQSNSNLMEDQ